VARGAAGGVGGAQESGLRRLVGCPPRHGFSERTLLLEQRNLSVSDQDIGSVADLLALVHEALRRLPHRLRPESYFRGQHRAAEEMGANGFGKVLPTPRAHVRAASAQDVGGEFRVAEADVTGRASGNDVTGAVDEDQRSLLRCQDVRALAVNVRQMAVGRLDDVGQRDRLGALRALHLRVTPRSPVSSGGPGRVHPDQV
jgi:hypothetical protein